MVDIFSTLLVYCLFSSSPTLTAAADASSEGTESTAELRLVYETAKAGFALNSDLRALQTQINGNLYALCSIVFFVVSRIQFF